MWLYIPGFIALLIIWLVVGGYSKSKKKRIGGLNKAMNDQYKMLAGDLNMKATTQIISSSEIQIAFPEVNGKFRGWPVMITGFSKGGFMGKKVWTEVVVRCKNPSKISFLISRAGKISSSGTMVDLESLGMTPVEDDDGKVLVIRSNNHEFVRSLSQEGILQDLFRIMHLGKNVSLKLRDKKLRYVELSAVSNPGERARISEITMLLSEIAGKASEWKERTAGFLS